MELKFDLISFDAAHYIRGHPICGGIHGHTYRVVGLTIDITDTDLNDQGISIDFGEIKGYFKENWDHKFMVPAEDLDFWNKNLVEDMRNKIKVVKYPSVEGIAQQILQELSDYLGWGEYYIHFTLYEGLNQGVSI